MFNTWEPNLKIISWVCWCHGCVRERESVFTYVELTMEVYITPNELEASHFPTGYPSRHNFTS